MNALPVLAAQMLVPTLTGYLIARYLRTVTRELLVELCGTAERSDFWTRVVTVLFVLAPLGTTLAFAHDPMRCTAADPLCYEGALRDTVVFTLFGALTPLLAVAWRVAREILVDARPAALPPAAPEQDAAAGASA